MSEPTWKTFDGRIIPMRGMGQDHLENTIKWFERRGIAGGLMTPEEREEDPVAKAEWLLSGLQYFNVVKYRQLLAERERRRAEVLSTRALMAATTPGQRVDESRAGTGGPGRAAAGAADCADDAGPVGLDSSGE